MVNTLLRRSGRRFLSQHRWQTALTIIGIMLGVAVVVSVDLANNSARKAFSLSLESVSGKISHQILGGPNGIPEIWYTRLRTELGLQNSAPIVTEQVSIKDLSFTLIGADPVSEWVIQRHTQKLQTGALRDLSLLTNAVMLSRRAADKLQLHEGDSFNFNYRGQQFSVQLSAIFNSDNPAATEGLLLTDIAIAQTLLQRIGTLDRIDLILNDKEFEQLRHWLPETLKLVASDNRNASITQMSEAFHSNLTAMSLLALLVGGLLIYNTMTFSVLQRRHTLGVYRSLGVTRREVFSLVLNESLLMGFVGTVTGLALGLALGQFLVQLVTRTVDDLYFSLHVSSFFFSPTSLLKGILLGMGMTMIAACLPAWEAARNKPVSVQQRSKLEQRWRSRLPILFAIGLAVMLLGYRLTVVEQASLLQGFIALTLLIIGFCLLVPTLVIGFTPLLVLILSPITGTVGRIAIRGISAGLSRTGLAVVALTVAISMTVGVGVMVNSFRQSVILWLNQSLTGDVYIGQPGRGRARSSGGLPSALISDLSQLEGVAGHIVSHSILAETEFGPMRLLAVEPGDTNNSNKQPLPLLESMPDAIERFLLGQGVFVSESLAYHQRLALGDSMNVQTEQGTSALTVLGVLQDYSSSRGRIFINLNHYRELWRDTTVSGLTLYRKNDYGQKDLLQAIRRYLAEQPIVYNVSSRSEIREVTLAVFDRTFAITHVLRLLAILVAFVGVLSSLLALQLERSREFAILRATGMTPGQMIAMVLLQTGLIGLLAGLLALPLGLLMSDVLIDVINRSSFGWSMQHHTPQGVLLEAVLLAVGAALIAGAYPAWRAARIAPARALREE